MIDCFLPLHSSLEKPQRISSIEAKRQWQSFALSQRFKVEEWLKVPKRLEVSQSIEDSNLGLG